MVKSVGMGGSKYYNMQACESCCDCELGRSFLENG